MDLKKFFPSLSSPLPPAPRESGPTLNTNNTTTITSPTPSSTTTNTNNNLPNGMIEILVSDQQNIIPFITTTNKSSSPTPTVDVKISPIAKYPTARPTQNSGTIVLLTNDFITYGVKQGMIRVIHIAQGARTLLKSHTQPLVDLSVPPPPLPSSSSSSTHATPTTTSSSQPTDKQQILSCAQDGLVILWEINTQLQENNEIISNEIYRLRAPSGNGVQRCLFHNKNSDLIFIAYGRSVCGIKLGVQFHDVYNSKIPTHTVLPDAALDFTASPVACYLTFHTRTVNDISFSNDGNQIITAGDDGYVAVWNLAKCFVPDCHPTHILPMFSQPVYNASFLGGKDERVLCGVGQNMTLSVWNISSSTSSTTSISSMNKPEQQISFTTTVPGSTLSNRCMVVRSSNIGESCIVVGDMNSPLVAILGVDYFGQIRVCTMIPISNPIFYMSGKIVGNSNSLLELQIDALDNAMVQSYTVNVSSLITTAASKAAIFSNYHNEKVAGFGNSFNKSSPTNNNRTNTNNNDTIWNTNTNNNMGGGPSSTSSPPPPQIIPTTTTTTTTTPNTIIQQPHQVISSNNNLPPPQVINTSTDSVRTGNKSTSTLNEADLEVLFQRLEQRASERDAAERERQRRLLDVMTKSLGNISAEVEEAIQTKLSSPEFLTSISERVTKDVMIELTKTLTELNRSIAKETSNNIAQKLPVLLEKTIESTTDKLALKITRHTQKQFEDNFKSALVPAFEAGCRDMVSQFKTSMLQVDFGRVVSTALASSDLTSIGAGNNNNSMLSSTSGGNLPQQQLQQQQQPQLTPTQIREERLRRVQAFLKAGNLDGALKVIMETNNNDPEQQFTIALQVRNRPLVIQTCRSVGLTSILQTTPCPLSGNVLLALLQTLCGDVPESMEILNWIESVALSVDDIVDPDIVPHIGGVASEARLALNSYQITPPNPLANKIKAISHILSCLGR
jgi:WD40 repeat protein